MATAETFLCGVVEGFYNRPWSHSQRLELFNRMKSFGLNAYLYAPKDDHKHRSLWREAYDEREKEELQTLIKACGEKELIFLYGISPGLDISYSSASDIRQLKTKLMDLKSLGCQAFALLWDDIDTTLPREDRTAFDSLAHAQVKVRFVRFIHSFCSIYLNFQVTNEVYEHLGRPLFLTCPVEYCANRADPNVNNSEYLNTLSGLSPDIGVFWTGGKVVSENITKEELILMEKSIEKKAHHLGQLAC